MKKKIIIIIAILIVIAAVVGIIYAGSKLHEKEKIEDNHLIILNFDELQKKVDAKETFILVVTQTTCSHCAEYKPVLKKVLAKYDIYAYEIEDDKLNEEEKAKLKDIASISGTPTTVFIVDGEEKSTANRLVGPADQNKLVSRFKAMGYIKE